MPDRLKFGLTGSNGGVTSYPEALVGLAQAAERAGFDSIWAGEHHVLATSSTMIPPTSRYLNPVVALTYVAAYTRTIRLGTGVLLLPQYQPLILAKELASLDVLAYPHPLQQPAPPIVVGGRSPAALRRAVEQANGWYGYAMDLDETAALLAQLHEAAGRSPRPASLGELEISVAPRVPLDKDTAQRFANLGVHRLILIPPRGMEALALEQWVKTRGETFLC